MRSENRGSFLAAAPLVVAASLLSACSGVISAETPQEGAPAAGGRTGAGGGGAQGGMAEPRTPPTDPIAPAGPADRGLPPAPGSAAFACDPASAAPSVQLLKLTDVQYRNGVRDLVTLAAGGPGPAAPILAQLAPLLDAVPSSERPKVAHDDHGTFRRLDQTVQQEEVAAFHRVASAAAAALTAADRVAPVLGPCAADAVATNDAACVADFIARLGARAHGRPLAAEETRLYASIYGAPSTLDRAALADVLTVMLSAPPVVYQVEHGAGEPGRTGAAPLSAYELAARLSRHFWQTIPDDGLWKAAESGRLLQDTAYRAEVDRLLADPRTAATIDGFFREWLKLEDVPNLAARVAEPAFKAFAGADLPASSLTPAIAADALDLVRHFTWSRADGSVRDLLTSDLSFARDPALARIYGVPAWNGTGAPPRLPPGPRAGLATRAAFLVSESGRTRPIMKGVFLRKFLLCEQLPPPPPDAQGMARALDPKMSQRQVAEALTEGPGSSCAACHAEIINPLGFATEGFDALGRARTVETVLDDRGRELARVPVDTRARVALAGLPPRDLAGAADLATLLADSGRVEACLARNYFRFTYGRWEDVAADGCALERLRQALVSGGGLRAMLREVALSPEFKERSFR